MRPSILATSIEAVLGVVYFEAGLDGVRTVLARHEGMVG
jgi:dsRNA-specific ribonuclease